MTFDAPHTEQLKSLLFLVRFLLTTEKESAELFQEELGLRVRKETDC